MFTGQKNRDSTMRRLLLLLLLVVVSVLTGGCGGAEENEAASDQSSAQMTPQAMVPAAADTTPVEQTDATAQQAQGTSNASSVHPSEAQAGEVLKATTTAKAEKPSDEVSSPFHRPQVSSERGAFSLQLGSYRSGENARKQVDRISELGFNPVVEVASLGGQDYHRVVLRGLADRDEAERLGEKIRSQLGITYLIRQK